MSQPPPLPARLLVLVLAVLAMLSAVCAHSRAPAPAVNPDANAAPGAVGAPDAGAAATPQSPANPEYFPATKAPGFLYKP